MLKKAAGNMYDWVTHTHSHLGGECPHRCSYCYVQTSKFGKNPRYQGPVVYIKREDNVDYGSGKVIFIEHMNDLFAQEVPSEFIHSVLVHCAKYPKNQYVFQTKNPGRFIRFMTTGRLDPLNYMLGVTIESNREYPHLSKAPTPYQRYLDVYTISNQGVKVFVTVEPILDLDPVVLVRWLSIIKPAFINIGADSKNCGLPEPTPATVKKFIELLGQAGVVIRKKINLARMLV